MIKRTDIKYYFKNRRDAAVMWLVLKRYFKDILESPDYGAETVLVIKETPVYAWFRLGVAVDRALRPLIKKMSILADKLGFGEVN